MKIQIVVCLLAFGLPSAWASFDASHAVKASYEAARKSDVEKLRKELSGAALEKFGNEEGAKSLAAESSFVKKFKFRTSLLDFVRDSRGLDSLRKYEVVVIGKPAQGEAKVLRTVTVSCTVRWERRFGACVPYPNPYACNPERLLVDLESCTVSDFN